MPEIEKRAFLAKQSKIEVMRTNPMIDPLILLSKTMRGEELVGELNAHWEARYKSYQVRKTDLVPTLGNLDLVNRAAPAKTRLDEKEPAARADVDKKPMDF